MLNRVLVVMMCTCCSVSVYAAELSSNDLHVDIVSIYDHGHIYVQTSPRHDITGLDCTNDYWMGIATTTPAYDALLASLLAAQQSSSKVTVTVNDDGTSQFCNLARLTIHR